MDSKAFTASDLKVDEGERAVTAYISTASVDRDNEVLLPSGANLREFQKNPVVLYGHNQFALPVGKATTINRDDKGIKAKAVFAKRPESFPEDAEWLPDTLLSLFQQGILKAFSVGFIPTETRPATDKDLEKFGANVRRVIAKWNLLEFSVVTIPSNPDALALAVSKSADALNRLYTPPPVQIPTKICRVRKELTFVPMPADAAPVARQNIPTIDYGNLTKRLMARSIGRVYID